MRTPRRPPTSVPAHVRPPEMYLCAHAPPQPLQHTRAPRPPASVFSRVHAWWLSGRISCHRRAPVPQGSHGQFPNGKCDAKARGAEHGKGCGAGEPSRCQVGMGPARKRSVQRPSSRNKGRAGSRGRKGLVPRPRPPATPATQEAPRNVCTGDIGENTGAQAPQPWPEERKPTLNTLLWVCGPHCPPSLPAREQGEHTN